MGRKSKSSRAAEKKRERLALEKRMNERVALVKKANEQEDPLEALPSFRSFNRNGLDVSLETSRVTSQDSNSKSWLMDLMVRNMKNLYEVSSWGWNESNKRDEMFDDNAWYLLAKTQDGTPVAFAHFRYDMDYDDEVLYVYEIQMEPDFRRKGLGKFMMQILELLAFKSDMRKIMLTVFKHNSPARKFFMDSLKFEVDETSPVDDVYEQFDYIIISKSNKRKLARENDSAVANA